MDTPYRYAHVRFAVLIPATLLGFWTTYFSILDKLPEKVTPLVHVHAALMSLWVFMLIGQAWFVKTKRFRLHRLVGRSSYVIAPVSVVLALAVLHEVMNRTPGGVPLEGPEGARLSILGFGQALAFGSAWVLAVLYRRQASLHVRFIVSTAFGMATAIVVRIFATWVPGTKGSLDASVAGNGGVLIGLLLVLIAADWRAGMRRSPYWVVTIVLFIVHLGFWTFARTEGWLVFCRWFADLPISVS